MTFHVCVTHGCFCSDRRTGDQGQCSQKTETVYCVGFLQKSLANPSAKGEGGQSLEGGKPQVREESDTIQAARNP